MSTALPHRIARSASIAALTIHCACGGESEGGPGGGTGADVQVAKDWGGVVNPRLALDAAGNAFIATSTSGPVDFADGPLTGGVLASFDPVGKLDWTMSAEDAGLGLPAYVAAGAAGELYLLSGTEVVRLSAGRKVEWRAPLSESFEPRTVGSAEDAVVVAAWNAVIVYDAATGAERTTTFISGTVADMMVDGDRFYVVANGVASGAAVNLEVHGFSLASPEAPLWTKRLGCPTSGFADCGATVLRGGGGLLWLGGPIEGELRDGGTVIASGAPSSMGGATAGFWVALTTEGEIESAESVAGIPFGADADGRPITYTIDTACNAIGTPGGWKTCLEGSTSLDEAWANSRGTVWALEQTHLYLLRP